MPKRFSFFLQVPSQYRGICIDLLGRGGRALTAEPFDLSGDQIKVAMTIPYFGRRRPIAHAAVQCLLAFDEIPTLFPQTELKIDNASISLADTDEEFLLKLFMQSNPRQASRLIGQRQKDSPIVLVATGDGRRANDLDQLDEAAGIRYGETLGGSRDYGAPKAAQERDRVGAGISNDQAIFGDSSDTDDKSRAETAARSDASIIQEPSSFQPPPPDPPTQPASHQPPPAGRFLQGRFPKSVRTHNRATLQVRVARTRGQDASAPLKTFDIPPEGADVLLVLYCPGFKALEKTQAHVLVPADSDSEWVGFELQAQELGVHNMEVNAYGPGGFIGTLPIQATVADEVDEGSPIDHAADAHLRPPAPGEFTLLIRYDRDAKVYRYQFIEGNLAISDEVSSLPLISGPEEKVNSMIGQLNLLARGKIQYDAKQTRDLMKALGVDLWNRLIPIELQNLFWDRRQLIKRIVIQSAGDMIPWEILYPYSDGRDFGFLSESFRLRDGPLPTRRRRTSVFHKPASCSPPSLRPLPKVR